MKTHPALGKNVIDAPDLSGDMDPPDEAVQAAWKGDLVLFVGSGISRLYGLPSWEGLAGNVLSDLRQWGLLTFSEVEQLRVLTPRKQLSIAQLIAQDNNRIIDYRRHLQNATKECDIYRILNDIGCTCVTTNYDTLLTPQVIKTDDGSTASVEETRIFSRGKLYPNLLDNPGTVIHLHGAIGDLETMIVTTKDYLEHYDDENVQAFLRSLFDKKTVVFMGYGLDEIEILEHILRRGSATKTEERKRFALQGFFGNQKSLYEKLYLYYKKSFSVHLLGFLRDYENYHCQIRILENWSRKLNVRQPPLGKDADLIDEVFPDD